jgi:hypothetical protein
MWGNQCYAGHARAGVIAGMEGMTVGEERSISATIGDTWWEPGALRGVDTRCDVALKELFEWDLPEVLLGGSCPAAAAAWPLLASKVHHACWTACSGGSSAAGEKCMLHEPFSQRVLPCFWGARFGSSRAK